MDGGLLERQLCGSAIGQQRMGVRECSERVLRGGSWFYKPSGLRAAFWVGNTSGVRYDNIGFRVARTLTP